MANAKSFLREELMREFDENELKNDVKSLYARAEDYLSSSGMAEEAYIDLQIFYYCCRDLFEDLARLRHFHDIRHEDDIKLFAYSAYWWIRRKPFQRIRDCSSDKSLYINEGFAATMLLQASGIYDVSTGKYKISEDEVIKMFSPVIYHLKYRNINPQTFELYLNGLNAPVH